MIVYLSEKSKFINDVDDGSIEVVIESAFTKATGRRVGESEKKSWKNSLGFMERIVHDAEIPNDAGVAIEFHIPRSSNRVDFILTGLDENDKRSVIIVELKQWSEVEVTDKDAIVKTFIGKSKIETPHPSYQAWSYSTLMSDLNEAIEKDEIRLTPCAYLHNCAQDDVLNDAQ